MSVLEEKEVCILPGDGTCFSHEEYSGYLAEICGVYTNNQGIMVFPTEKWINYPTSQSQSAAGQYLRYVTKFTKNYNVAIDIGAGLGNTMAWCVPKFKEIHAVEPNPYFAKMLRQQYGKIDHVHIHEKRIQEALNELPYADFIGCSHLFYHIDINSWHSILDRVVEKLAPGGVLAIALTADQGKQYEFLERMYPGHTCIKQIKSYFDYRLYDTHSELHSSMFGPTDLDTILKIQQFLVAEDAFPKAEYDDLTIEQKRRFNMDIFLFVTGALKLPGKEQYEMDFLNETLVYVKPTN